MMTVGRWRVAAASTAGISHRRRQMRCQDAHAVTTLGRWPDEALVAAVSDGAGSASQGALGAKLAVWSFIEIVRMAHAGGTALGRLDRAGAERWIRLLQRVLRAVAEGRGVGLEDFACTLLGAIVLRDRLLLLQVGDGAMVVSDGSGSGWRWVFWPQHGEYAESTWFVTDEGAAGRMLFANVDEPVEELAIFSDGLERLVLRDVDRRAHDPFFEAVFRPLRIASAQSGLDARLSASLGRLLASPTIVSRTDDDTTLVLASRRAVPAGA